MKKTSDFCMIHLLRYNLIRKHSKNDTLLFFDNFSRGLKLRKYRQSVPSVTDKMN